jgi:kynurenine formamidase
MRTMTRRSALAAGLLGGAGIALKGRTAEAQTAAAGGTPAAVLGGAVASGAWEVIDLSVTTGEEYPVAFPDQPQFKVVPLTWFKRRKGPTPPGASGDAKKGIAAVNAYEITEHTGTQIDFPPHFIPPPGVNIPGSPGRAIGRRTGDRFPLSALMGPAVVLDLRAVLAANTAKGKSAKVGASWIERWEARYGRIGKGEVPVLFSGYTDRYYKPFPDGNRFKDRLLWKPLIDKSEPAWVVLAPDAVELLWSRGVAHIATDAPSFGAAEDPQESHVAGLKHGMTWTESAISLGKLPLRGAFFVCAPYKVLEQQAGIVRAFAFSPKGAAGTESGPPLEL